MDFRVVSEPVTPIQDKVLPIIPPLQGEPFDGSLSLNSSRKNSRKGSRSIIHERLQSPVRLDPTSRSDTGFHYRRSSLDIEFNAKTLVWLSDTVRASMSARNASRSFGTASDSLLIFLERAMQEEAEGTTKLDFETLKQAHLDKLVAEMIEFGKNDSAGSARELGYATQAAHLQRIWRLRYKVQYFMIDEIRTIDMLTTGSLHNVRFVVEKKDKGDKADWIHPFALCPGNMEYPTGYWWLNIACAHRDGFVATDLEKPTIRDHDHTALPLLTGREEILTDHSVKYIRVGKLGDVHHSLFSQIGKKIHLMRGYQLKSDLAPTEGVRYDGQWTLRSFSHKLDVNADLYRLELRLEPPVSLNSAQWQATKAVPLPSQRDEWNLYKKLEGDKIRQTQGELGQLDWKIKEEMERADREDAQRVRSFRLSVGSIDMMTSAAVGMRVPSVVSHEIHHGEKRGMRMLSLSTAGASTPSSDSVSIPSMHKE
ncbi:hypothetical protein V8F33_001302 [Rhypophila sp. PSN 637]